MRSGQVIGQIIGAALLVLALGAGDDAEARGRGARVARVATIGTAPVAATGSIGAASATTTDPGLRPVKAVAAPSGSVREVRAPDAWCASRRLVGTGTGFCLVN